MSFIKVPVKDAKEREIVPEGEYDLQIEDATFRSDKNDIMVRLSIIGYDNAKPVFEFLGLVDPAKEKETNNLRLCRIKAFAELFGVDDNNGEGFNEEDFYGCQARCNLIQDEYEGQVSNKLRYRW